MDSGTEAVREGRVVATDKAELIRFALKEQKARGKNEVHTRDAWEKKHGAAPQAAAASFAFRSGAGACDICARPIASPDGYLLITDTVVSTPAYWKRVLPEMPRNTLGASYQSHPRLALQMIELRQMAAAEQLSWMACEGCIALFDVPADQPREWAQLWWATAGNFAPPGSGAVPPERVALT
jgi:hypothetical protein